VGRREVEWVKSPAYLIIGCGHSGSRAARKIFQENSRARVTLIDKNSRALEALSSWPAERLEGEAIPVLSQLLSSGQIYDIIIPAVPFHVAFEFVLWRLAPQGMRRAEVPASLSLPNATRGKTGDVYTTLARFTCPEDCNEPARCTVTGRKRERPLYKVLADLSGAFDLRVIRSRQLAPGMGGFRTSDLLRLLKDLERREASDRPFLISTACCCHGVISALSS
jgi:hypothetical protein